MTCKQCGKEVEPKYECDGGICWDCFNKNEAREFVQARLNDENFDAAKTLDDLTEIYDGDPSDLF